MLNWQEVLDRIVARDAPKPPHVEIMRLPGIDGWEPGHVWCQWTVDEAFIQPQGAIFGGYIAAIADEILGLATLTTLNRGERFVTADMRVNFFRPIKDGIVTVDATVQHKGRTNIFAEATFTDPQGNLCAKAAATQSVVRSAEHS
jgi:uncharacterized protein (TIGR00369 family)